MVDITAKLFWFRSKEWYGIMADKFSEIVYTDESKETLNVINLLLLGWILLGLIVYILGNVVASYIRKRKSSLPKHESETAAENSAEHVTFSEEIKSSCSNDLLSGKQEGFSPNFEIPICEGDDPEIVEWINDVFSWIYKQRVVSPIKDSWLTALNARTRLSSTEHGILVDFKEILHSSGSPKVTEVVQSSNSKSDANLSCLVEQEDIKFEVIVTQFKEKDKVVIPFILNVQRICGRVTVDCSPEDLSFVTKFSETPQIQLSSEAVSKDDEFSQSEEYRPLCDLVCEITSDALSSAIVPLRLNCFPACPRLMPKGSHQDETVDIVGDDQEKKLLVKIIKASNLGGAKGCLKPYCVVEMDEPPQKFETHFVDGTHNPFWDESVTFTVKDSAELLFEIYDKDKPSNENFLGLGIVGIDELVKNPSQRQIIPLQSRPLEDDDVTGSLTAEFVFLNQSTPVIETTHLSQYVGKEDSQHGDGKVIETNSRVTAGGTVITTTTIKRTTEEISGRLDAKHDSIANSISAHYAEPNLITPSEMEEPLTQTTVSELHAKNNGVDVIADDHRLSNGYVLSADQCTNAGKMPELDPNANDSSSSIELNSTSEDLNYLEPSVELESVDMHGLDITQIALNSVARKSMHEAPIIPIPVIEEALVNGSVFSKADQMHALSDSIQNESTVLKETDISNGPVASEVENESSSLANGFQNKMDVEADLPGTALKELEKHSTPTATSKSTLIIHSVQRPETSELESLEASPASHVSKDANNSHSESLPSSPSLDKSKDERSRPKEKKSFMGTLKRRLSFHKNRSKSAENRAENNSSYSQASSRSASTDRGKQSSNNKMSPFKKSLLGQYLTLPAGSTRSSLSEASGISASSNRTYINEKSTLVIETNENGIIKRYLIPNSLIHRSKWKKRGTKLHVFNDHVFIAKHMSGSTLCQVCQKYLTRRPGKQGYECRGCNLQCHKTCHVKTETYCSNSTINSMEVEYIHDPKGASPKSI